MSCFMPKLRTMADSTDPSEQDCDRKTPHRTPHRTARRTPHPPASKTATVRRCTARRTARRTTPHHVLAAGARPDSPAAARSDDGLYYDDIIGLHRRQPAVSSTTSHVQKINTVATKESQTRPALWPLRDDIV